MRFLLLLMTVIVFGLSVAPQDAEARWFKRNRGFSGRSGGSTGAHMEYVSTEYSTEKRFYNATMSLQDIATMRAQWMAHNNSLDHNIHNYTDAPPWPSEVGEGIGCSTASDPKDVGTCIVGSRVVADGHCRARGGLLYRVRFFR